MKVETCQRRFVTKGEPRVEVLWAVLTFFLLANYKYSMKQPAHSPASIQYLPPEATPLLKLQAKINISWLVKRVVRAPRKVTTNTAEQLP